MKILVICQYYYPEPFRIHNICEELVRRGHEVTVVTGEPNYPEGTIYKGYENHKISEEILNGVRVQRCPIIPRKTGTVYRALNYYSYSFSAKRFVLSKRCIASDGKAFDIVFVNQLSPVMMAEPAIAYKEKYNIPILMYCLDLWPASLIAGGVKKNSLSYKFFHKVSKRIYTKMDRILVTSKMFKQYLMENFNVDEEDIEYLPQYAEDVFKPLSCSKEKDTVDFMFAGNIGTAQSVITILKAAEFLKNEPKIHFHIIGGGTELPMLQEKSKNLSNVTFYGRRPLEEMPYFYNKADAMIVTLKADPILSYTLPGKVQSYMAVGKPIIGAINGEAADVINNSGCGFCGKAEDVDELVSNIRKFVKFNNKEILCINSRAFYEKEFNRVKFMDRLENNFQCLTNTSY